MEEALLLRMLAASCGPSDTQSPGSTDSLDNAMIDALLSKSNESQHQLISAILGGDWDSPTRGSFDEVAHAALVSRIAHGSGLSLRVDDDGVEQQPFDYVAHLPRFIEAMRARKAKENGASHQKTVMGSLQHSADGLEEETLEDGDGPQSVLDAMLSSSDRAPTAGATGSDVSSAWREAARGVVFDNFFSVDEEDSSTVATQQQPTKEAGSASKELKSSGMADDGESDDEDIALPEVSSSSPPLVQGTSPDDPQELFNALKEIAQGEDGVEAFSLDAKKKNDEEEESSTVVTQQQPAKEAGSASKALKSSEMAEDGESDDEDIALPEVASSGPPLVQGTSQDAPQELFNALKEIAQGEDGVEAFSLDATHDYDVNLAGTSRRI
ncbi:Hypothetical protein, putative [Bodo saltans]|uniref:Uncharacterized protein n=1 Tax=Bodo saltans TaxID=75058 RepID=A0A0S4IRS4_BODSA|nr:Hypothetical protein, putative [Bodo saltans]|eukprot:CUE70548.1 Hypothetical protein, putative [Bodo saltans]